MLNIKERVRRAVYQCFPEMDIDSGARSWPSTMLDRLRSLNDRLASLSAAVQVAAHQRRGTVVLLPPAEFKGLKFLSQTVVGVGSGGSEKNFLSSAGTTVTVCFEHLGFFLPPGGWIVAHGCQLDDVFVGNQSQTKAPAGEFCQITDELPLGVRLHARVRFD